MLQARKRCRKAWAPGRSDRAGLPSFSVLPVRPESRRWTSNWKNGLSFARSWKRKANRPEYSGGFRVPRGLPGTGARFPLGSHLLSPPLSASCTGCLAGLQAEGTHGYLRAFALTVLSAWGALRSTISAAAPSRLADVYQCHVPWPPSKTVSKPVS